MKLKDIKNENRNGCIELYGNKQILIDGCKGVIDYSESFIKLDLGNITLKIMGNALVIESYIYEQIDLKGEIVSLEFMN